MAARRASFPTLKAGTPEHTGVRRHTPVPDSLPKESRALAFESADRSSVRALSQVAPVPTPDEAGAEEVDDEVDTLSFRRSEPTPQFAPPLPIPPREAIEHPTGARRRAVVPAPADLGRPQTMRIPVLPPKRRVPWGGIAVLTLSALIGAAVGWWATPYVHGEAPPATAD